MHIIEEWLKDFNYGQYEGWKFVYNPAIGSLYASFPVVDIRDESRQAIRRVGSHFKMNFNSPSHEEAFLKRMAEIIIELSTHEIYEQIIYKGERPFNPHKRKIAVDRRVTL
jgi:hypothetical protein